MTRPKTEDGEDRCPWHDTLVELLGRGGKNGRVGNLEKSMKKIEAELVAVKAVQLKLMLWVSLAAGGSTAAVSTAFKYLHG